MKQVITLRVNGTEYTLAAEPNATLADVLREELRFTGVKKGCDDGECGACSVLLDKCKVKPRVHSPAGRLRRGVHPRHALRKQAGGVGRC